MSRYLNFVKKSLKRVVTNTRRVGLESAVVILDQDFGSNRGTPLDRQLINEFLKWSTESIPVPRRTLEFGDTVFTQELFRNSENWIFKFTPNQSVRVECNFALSGDLLCGVEKDVPVFDVIVSTQLLAFTEDPFSAARTLVSLLGVDGKIVGTEPQFSPISRYDDSQWGDFFRFTQKGIDSIFTRTGSVKIETFPIGNWATTLAIFQGFCLEDNLNLPKENSNNYASNVGFKVTKTGY